MKDFFVRESYSALLSQLTEADRIISEKLFSEIHSAGIPTLEIAHRIKDADSAIEKLRRKSDNYSDIADLTDLIGFRIICYFSDDVDKIAAVVEKLFVIDRDNSVDKRQIISPTAFGYLSLHYICSLPESSEYPKELCNIKFEIQMRSSLQHTWAEIEHDLGYKSMFAIPREVRREFSRIAGLLELADESFVRIRSRLNAYTEQITNDIKNGKAADISIDLVTLNTYLKYNTQMKAFMDEIAELQSAAVIEQSPESYLPMLAAININTLGDLEKLLEREHDHAIELAEELFKAADLDEITSTAGLHFLCRAELIYCSIDKNAVFDFFTCGAENRDRARQQAKRILKKRKALSEQSEI
ncbi:MAG: hypothetical protein IJR45_01255 [Firmicutes bacterium]|nr:hypothetical protein [Bacillota bacterium]